MESDERAHPAPQLVRARFAIVTPMFLGGARQQAEPIRPPSVKGALRFWWRALNWEEFRAKAEKDETLQGKEAKDAAALCHLHHEEARLFGASAEQGGQGCFLLSVKPALMSTIPVPGSLFKHGGEFYLAGMGLGDRQALLTENEVVFEIVLRFRPGVDSKDKDTLDKALRLFGLIGGLGSRNRRGFGSVARLVPDPAGWRLPTAEEFEGEKTWLKAVISVAPPGRAPFSAITNDAAWYRGAEYDSAKDAMEKMGAVFNRYRTNGTKMIRNRVGVVNRTARAGFRIIDGEDEDISENSLRFFPTDHHHVHAIASAAAIHSPHDVPPERSIFGLPHPYKFSSLWQQPGEKVSYDFEPSWESDHGKGRRASPLLMHIAAFTRNGQRKYQPLCLLLPSDFLPANEQIHVLVGNNDVGNVSAPTDYQVIRDFLNERATAPI